MYHEPLNGYHTLDNDCLKALNSIIQADLKHGIRRSKNNASLLLLYSK